MKTTDDVSLLDFLPSSIAQDENVIASAKSIDPHLRELYKNVDIAAILANIDKLTSVQLDHLAMGYDVRPWRDSWSVALKRSAVKANIINKRKRGTLAAVKAAVESLGSAVRIVSWYEKDPPGTPGTFTIYVALNISEGLVAADMQEDIQLVIDEVKPFSRHYEFILQMSLAGGIGVYGCVRVATLNRLSVAAVLPN